MQIHMICTCKQPLNSRPIWTLSTLRTQAFSAWTIATQPMAQTSSASRTALTQASEWTMKDPWARSSLASTQFGKPSSKSASSCPKTSTSQIWTQWISSFPKAKQLTKISRTHRKQPIIRMKDRSRALDSTISARSLKILHLKILITTVMKIFTRMSLKVTMRLEGKHRIWMMMIEMMGNSPLMKRLSNRSSKTSLDTIRSSLMSPARANRTSLATTSSLRASWKARRRCNKPMAMTLRYTRRWTQRDHRRRLSHRSWDMRSRRSSLGKRWAVTCSTSCMKWSIWSYRAILTQNNDRNSLSRFVEATRSW